jgi:threonine dehydratase
VVPCCCRVSDRGCVVKRRPTISERFWTPHAIRLTGLLPCRDPYRIACHPGRRSTMTALAVDPAPGIEDVRRAQAAIAGAVIRTPTRHSQTLSQITGTELWFKFENQQFTASFKERGALNKLISLTEEERNQGVVAASAGNHAQAVAYHARRLGVAATIVMPLSTPFIKVSHTEVLGARIVQVGDTVDESRARASELAKEQGLIQVPPFEDALVIAGQGTAALELLEDAPAPDVIVVPVGGGGLISGIATVVRALCPATKVVGVQAERFSVMAGLFAAARNPQPQLDNNSKSAPPRRFGVDTLADGIAVKVPGQLTRRLIIDTVDEMLTVSERFIEQAVNQLLELEKTVAEGAGAVGLAAVLQHAARFRGQRVACIISGGNMDPRVMADTILRGLVRTGRLSRLRVDARDLPGSLADITGTIADSGANIVEVLHERVYLTSPDRRTRLSIEIATRHRTHAEQVAAALRATGHDVELL